jgi:hypothetical protein
MLKAMGILSTSEPVKGIIVNPHGVEIGPDIPVLDSHRVANGVLGHLERAWIEDDSSLWGELISTGRAGRRVYELIERGSLSGVSCRFETLCVAICDVDCDALDVEEALEWGPDDPDLVLHRATLDLDGDFGHQCTGRSRLLRACSQLQCRVLAHDQAKRGGVAAHFA